MPAIGTTLHSPPNQFCTAEYQSKLVGRKMNPSAGMSHVVNIPWNQFVNSHNATTVNRGTSTPNNRINKGICQPLASYPAKIREGIKLR